MKLLKAVSLAKGFSKELSYFSKKRVQIGDLVLIRLKNREVPALIVAAESLKENKATVRSFAFRIKRVSKIKKRNFIQKEVLAALKKTADYFVAELGNTIKETIPQAILKSPSPLPFQKLIKTSSGGKKPSLLQLPQKARISYLKNLVRSSFAKNQSVFLCLPTIELVDLYKNFLKKGIEKYVFSFSGKTPAREICKKWSLCLKQKHPVLIIATPLFLSLQKRDVKTIIVEKESSSHYKKKNRPFLDLRTLAENLAKEREAAFILADDIIRVETAQRMILGEINTLTKPTFDTTSGESLLIDMRGCKSVLANETKTLLKKAKQNNERVILFINRQGHSPTTICTECGNIITCPNCDMPMVLHKDKNSGFFLCHKCLFKTKTLQSCPRCGGWRLQMFGIGIQKVGEEVKKLRPGEKFYQLHGGIAKSPKQAKEIINQYLNAPSGILLTTEMLFSYFNKKVEKAAVVSLDALFSIPDFAINEKVFKTLLQLKGMTTKAFLIQTRLPDYPVFQTILKGNPWSFYEKELQSRKKFGYPPFKILIKISKEGNDKLKLQNEVKALEKRLETHKPLAYTGFYPKIKNKYRLGLVLKVDPKTWPGKQNTLHQILSSLGRQWKIEVNPENLL
jgi:primosomal protein N' (replication factor Y)